MVYARAKPPSIGTKAPYPGFVEPALYLLSIGIGVGGLIGKVPGPGGQMVSYKEFVAPGLMVLATVVAAVTTRAVATGPTR